MGDDIGQDIVQQVQEARRAGSALAIQGGGTKGFYGGHDAGKSLTLAGHRGVVSYEPTELVVSVRAGTLLADLEDVLAEQGQMLAFEPPRFDECATIGGTLACGFSGPRRPFSGSARDFVLGTRIVNGKGELLRFGGEVMKNVAGYDVSRLMVGALGTLGVLLEVSLKVLPRPAAEVTLVQEHDPDGALACMADLGGKPHPLSGLCHDGTRLYVRLSGATSAVSAAARNIGGEILEDGVAFWASVKEHQHQFFSGPGPIWRVSVPPSAPLIELAGPWFLDWGGAQRWFRGDHDVMRIRAAAEASGGHATAFRDAAPGPEVFHPLPAAVMRLHQALKAAFDPERILNPDRLYTGL